AGAGEQPELALAGPAAHGRQHLLRLPTGHLLGVRTGQPFRLGHASPAPPRPPALPAAPLGVPAAIPPQRFRADDRGKSPFGPRRFDNTPCASQGCLLTENRQAGPRNGTETGAGLFSLPCPHPTACYPAIF